MPHGGPRTSSSRRHLEPVRNTEGGAHPRSRIFTGSPGLLYFPWSPASSSTGAAPCYPPHPGGGGRSPPRPTARSSPGAHCRVAVCQAEPRQQPPCGGRPAADRRGEPLSVSWTAGSPPEFRPRTCLHLEGFSFLASINKPTHDVLRRTLPSGSSFTPRRPRPPQLMGPCRPQARGPALSKGSCWHPDPRRPAPTYASGLRLPS